MCWFCGGCCCIVMLCVVFGMPCELHVAAGVARFGRGHGCCSGAVSLLSTPRFSASMLSRIAMPAAPQPTRPRHPLLRRLSGSSSS